MLLFIQKYTHTHANIHTHTQRETHTFETEKCDVILGKQLILHGEMSVMAVGLFAHFLFNGYFFSNSLYCHFFVHYY